MREGLEIATLTNGQIEKLDTYRSNGYLDLQDNRLVLTATGRLIADRIVREITF
jgi:oxygen-independent coproporphyrinogen-3 oxidase